MTKIVIIQDAGFFSCCSIRLQNTIRFFNSNKVLPDIVDSSRTFSWYKHNPQLDVTFNYFKDYTLLPSVLYERDVDYDQEYQYLDYKKLDYSGILPFIQKYFTPSENIQNIVKHVEEKYKIDHSNICVLFYRGNDKNRETKICKYSDYFQYADTILKETPEIKFLIQSDETEFIEEMQKMYPNNSFWFKDEIRHMKKQNSSVDILMKNNIDFFSSNYLAITIIMSKCKFIICGTGNCSIWMMFFRGNANNVYQNLNGNWI